MVFYLDHTYGSVWFNLISYARIMCIILFGLIIFIGFHVGYLFVYKNFNLFFHWHTYVFFVYTLKTFEFQQFLFFQDLHVFTT